MAIEKFLSSIVVDGTISKVGGTSSQFLKADGSIDSSTYSLSSHTHTFASLTSKPTTLAGYGITDAMTLNTMQTIGATKTFYDINFQGGLRAMDYQPVNTSESGGYFQVNHYIDKSWQDNLQFVSQSGSSSDGFGVTYITCEAEEGAVIGARSLDASLQTRVSCVPSQITLYTQGSSTTIELNSPTVNIFANTNIYNKILGVTSEGTVNDPYGKISVTRGTASNFSYYGLTRAGSIGWSLGINTTNDFIIGTGGSGAGIISSTAFKMANGGNATFFGSVTANASFIANSGAINSQFVLANNGVNKWQTYLNTANDSYNIYGNGSNRLTILTNGAATFSSNITAADIYGAAFIGSGGVPSNNTESGGVIGIRHSPDKSFYDSFYFYSRDGSDHDGFGNASMACNAEEGTYMSTSNLAGTLVATIGVNAGGQGVILSATNQITIDTPNTYISGKVSLGQSTYHKPATTQCAGEIVYYGTGTTVAGKLYYLSTGLVWTLADSDAAASSSGMLGIAIGTNPATNGMLVRGSARFDALTPYTAMTAGQILYVSTTAGDFTATAPTGTGKVVRVIGYCVDDTNNTLYFCPDNTWIELT